MAIPLTPEFERLSAMIEQGWQSAQRRELVDGDEVFDRIDAELEG